MDLQKYYVNLLTDSDSSKRADAARVLGMVDEADALDALAKAFRQETDTTVKSVLSWAGKRLHEARTAGYSTFNQIWQQFQIDREFAPDKTADDEYLEYVEHMQRYEEQVRQEIEFEKAFKKTQRGVNLVLGGPSRTTRAAQEEFDKLKLMNSSRVQIPGATTKKPKRAKPLAPTDTPITIHTRRLLEHPDPDQRRKAAATLADINNTAALPALSQAFKDDKDETVRTAAQAAGKRIYLNAIYWTLDQSGFIDQEIARRAPTVKTEAPPKQEVDPARATQEREAIEALFKRKEEKRKKR